MPEQKEKRCHNELNDSSLASLYQARKAQIKAPPAIKRSTLNAQRSGLQNRHMWQHLGNVALAASTLILVLITFWHHRAWYDSSQVFANKTYTQVTLHSLAPTKQSQAISERFATHYADYLAQRDVLVMHHQKHAVLAQVSDGWQLQTCDAQIVRVSQGLIDALRNIQQIEGRFHQGDFVDVRFGKNGIILGIERSMQGMHC